MKSCHLPARRIFMDPGLPGSGPHSAVLPRVAPRSFPSLSLSMTAPRGASKWHIITPRFFRQPLCAKNFKFFSFFFSRPGNARPGAARQELPAPLPLGLASGRRAGPASEFSLAREPRASFRFAPGRPRKLAETNIRRGLPKKRKITRF